MASLNEGEVSEATNNAIGREKILAFKNLQKFTTILKIFSHPYIIG